MINPDKAIELAIYFKTSPQKITEQYRLLEHLPGFVKWTQISIEDWNRRHINQKDRSAIEGWYNTQDNYVYELMEIYSQKPKQRISQQVRDFCHEHNVKTLLDYGCGIGEESILAAKDGFEASMADIPSRTFEFTRWRAAYHHVLIKSIEIHSDTPLRNKYDAITCFEVLPQIWNPKKVLHHLIAHLHPGGFLFLTVRFNMPRNSAILTKNAAFGKKYKLYIKSLGCRLVENRHQYGKGRNAKFLEIYQKLPAS